MTCIHQTRLLDTNRGWKDFYFQMSWCYLINNHLKLANWAIPLIKLLYNFNLLQALFHPEEWDTTHQSFIPCTFIVNNFLIQCIIFSSKLSPASGHVLGRGLDAFPIKEAALSWMLWHWYWYSADKWRVFHHVPDLCFVYGK